MKIAVLTSGILPVPAVQGGAVENLIDFYLEYNDHHRLHDITVYSVAHPAARRHQALLSTVNHYYFIDTSSIKARMKRKIREWQRAKGEYYNNFIEYYFEQAYRHIQKNHYDYIIIENRPGYVCKLSLRGFSNLILHLHNDNLHKDTPKARIIFEHLKMVITVSDYINQQVKTISNSHQSSITKVVTVYNGINLQQFNKKEKTIVTRTNIGFTDNDFVVVYSGRLNKEKGIVHLIEAMLLLIDQPLIKLMVVGSTFFANSTTEDPFILSLKEKAQPIKERIIFTGFVPYEDMPDYLQLADIAVVPSICSEAFGLTVAEAQAMGLPTITTSQGGIPEIVTPDSAIVLSTDKHFEQNLADAIRQLYNSPQQRAKMATAAQRNAVRYNKNDYARDFFNTSGTLSPL